MRYKKEGVVGLLSLLFVPMTLLYADEHSASDFLTFFETSDQDCEDRGGLRVSIRNTHPEQMIDVHLDRYFYDIRQADRSMFPLKAGQAQALGCNRAFDVEQRWELVSATFITPQAAEQRYGNYELFYRK